jgi:hypothetical protein
MKTVDNKLGWICKKVNTAGCYQCGHSNVHFPGIGSPPHFTAGNCFKPEHRSCHTVCVTLKKYNRYYRRKK